MFCLVEETEAHVLILILRLLFLGLLLVLLLLGSSSSRGGGRGGGGGASHRHGGQLLATCRPQLMLERDNRQTGEVCASKMSDMS